MAKLEKLIKRDVDVSTRIDSIDIEIGKLREKQRALAAEHSSIRVKIKAERKLAGMSDEEQHALAQALAAKGIDSSEAVGTPGAA